MQQTALLQRTKKPAFPLPIEQGSYWLLINGACSESLEEQVVALNGRRHHHWLWRGTAREYGIPGYRQGPMLVPLNEALFDTFVNTWASDSAGLIILAPADTGAVISHLSRLSTLTTANGNPVDFHLGMLRQLEELAAALTDFRLAQVLGPIASLLWQSPADTEQWVKLPNPHPATDGPYGQLLLDAQEETALNHASTAWFMRCTLQRIAKEQPGLVQQFDATELTRRLEVFKQEADQVAIVRERDLYRYFLLRLRYPQQRFTEDPQLLELLSEKALDARLRLNESEYRLQQPAPDSPRTRHVHPA